jgi:hypothetical protein
VGVLAPPGLPVPRPGPVYRHGRSFASFWRSHYLNGRAADRRAGYAGQTLRFTVDRACRRDLMLAARPSPCSGDAADDADMPGDVDILSV